MCSSLASLQATLSRAKSPHGVCFHATETEHHRANDSIFSVEKEKSTCVKQAYLFYTPIHKWWVVGIAVIIRGSDLSICDLTHEGTVWDQVPHGLIEDYLHSIPNLKREIVRILVFYIDASIERSVSGSPCVWISVWSTRSQPRCRRIMFPPSFSQWSKYKIYPLLHVHRAKFSTLFSARVIFSRMVFFLTALPWSSRLSSVALLCEL